MKNKTTPYESSLRFVGVSANMRMSGTGVSFITAAPAKTITSTAVRKQMKVATEQAFLVRPIAGLMHEVVITTIIGRKPRAIKL
jgi:hypothetical protein